MTTPNDALDNARAWEHCARTCRGPERDHALHAARYWYEVHRRASTPSADPVFRSGPRTASRTRRRSGGTGVVALATVLTLAVCGAATAGTAAVLRAMTSGQEVAVASADWADPTGDASTASGEVTDGVPFVAPEAVTPDAANPTPTSTAQAVPTPRPTAQAAQSVEALWKAGVNASVLPDPVPTSRTPTAFLPDHPDPEAWLVTRDAANEGIRVVFTDDPSYNCGMPWVVEHGFVDSGAAGCYDPAYPRVLFMYWSPEAAPELKEFVIAHELSHLIQWWQKFDVVYSVEAAGLGSDAAWKVAVESDATCRVLSWGGYSDQVAARSSSPCTTDSWSEDWLAGQTAALGVTITDY